MSVEIKTIEFEKRQAHLTSELDDGPPYTVHGVALGEGDVTRGMSGIEKIWPAEELKAAADTLEGRSFVEDHENSSRGVIGEVTKAGYKEGVGVIYEAELFDEELAERISNGLLEVSIRGRHKDVDEMEETEDGVKVVEDIEFENLSIVPSGASPSNTIDMGPAEELSVATLSQYVSTLQEEESEDVEIEPGMWVEWSDGKGITISQSEDGEIEVDVYEEADGKWRSTGETTMVSTGSLSEWDVDEEEDIGAREDEEVEDDEAENETHDMDPDVDDDEEEEAAKHHHRKALDKLEDFLTADENDDNTAITKFVEWADSDAVQMAVDEFSTLEGFSADSNLIDLKRWLEAVIGVEPETEGEGSESEEAAKRGEGEEEILDSESKKKEQSGEERNPDGAFDDEYEEASEDSSDEAESLEAEGTEASADEGSSEESDVEELQEWEFHEASWDGTTESDWSRPDMEDFDTDDLSEVASHFLISQTGFQPENFTDLALPVVEPNGDLNVNALSAVKGGRGVSAVEGLSDDMEKQIVDYVNGLANEHFDRDWETKESASTTRDVPTDEATPQHEMDPDVEDDTEEEAVDPVSAALDLINLFLRINGRDERDSVDKMLGWLFSSTDVPTEKMEAFRTAANAFLDQQGGADSFDAVDVESFRDWLLTHGGQTDDGTNARPTSGGSPPIATPVHVLSGDDLRSYNGASKKNTLTTTEVYNNMTQNFEEELEELDEPVAVEKSDLEQLQEKADRMDEMSETLSDLKERTDVLDSVDDEQVEELAESDDPMVIETGDYEALSAEAEQVKALYAEQLAEGTPFDAEDYTDKFSIEELREKYEAAGGDLEEELSAEPKSGDVDEEELEERAEEDDQSEEELQQAEQIESEQERLRDMITGN